jgi:hypothetical protein
VMSLRGRGRAAKTGVRQWLDATCSG